MAPIFAHSLHFLHLRGESGSTACGGCTGLRIAIVADLVMAEIKNVEGHFFFVEFCSMVVASVRGKAAVMIPCVRVSAMYGLVHPIYISLTEKVA